VDALATDTETEIDPSRGTSFHRELAALAGNTFLATALEGVLTLLYRTRWMEIRSPQSREAARLEHAAIADALGARDADAAELAVLEHLRGTRQRLLESLEATHRGLRASGLTLEGRASLN
jgi:DNA-binding FadR family transcriptional regulator